MSYIKTTWVTGDIVTAPRMNNIENGIYNNDAAISALQTKVTDLQTTTGNLIPSIAEVFSTSSTYAVGDHVMYNGRLYECKTAITTAGAWNASRWNAVSVYKYDDLVGVIKITNASITMATIEATLANVNAIGDHVVFDVSALSSGMKLCTIYLNNGRYHIVDITTGYEGDGTYSSADTLASILAKGSEPFYITDSAPYLFRQTPYTSIGNKEMLEQLVGGSFGWNQLIPQITATAVQYGITYASTGNGTWTITGALESGQGQGWYNLNYTANVQKIINGHVYYVRGCDTQMRLQFVSNGTGVLNNFEGEQVAKVTIGSNDTSTWVRFQTLNHSSINKTFVPQVIDLTAMFGSTIADYIYSLETATEGSGIAWLSKYIDLSSYHAYDAGSIQSVEATAHVTTGFNQWDGKYEAGTYNQTTGEKSSSQASLTNRSANKVRIMPNTTYYHVGGGMRVFYYDRSESYISNAALSSAQGVFTTPTNAHYLTFQISNTLDMGAICINISKTTGSPKNGDYVPYNGHSYSLGSDTLRGIPQLVNNELQYDGDVKTPDGTITRNYGTVDLGTLNWNIGSTGTYRRFYTTETNLAKRPATQDVTANIISAQYQSISLNALLSTDKAIAVNMTGAINISDSAYASNTAAEFKAAMSGKYLVYEKVTPTTESGTAYQRIQTVDADGIESFTANTVVPVGHVTKYPQNVLAIAEQIDDSFPVAPSTNGTYTLQAVVSNGVPTYRWISGQTSSLLSTTSQRATASLLTADSPIKTGTLASIEPQISDDIDGTTNDVPSDAEQDEQAESAEEISDTLTSENNTTDGTSATTE